MPIVEFKLEVGVTDEELPENPTDEEIADQAREIMYSAPMFDGLDEHFIANELEVNDVIR